MTSVLAAVDRTAAVTIVLLLYSASSSFTLDNSTQAWRSLLFADSSFSLWDRNRVGAGQRTLAFFSFGLQALISSALVHLENTSSAIPTDVLEDAVYAVSLTLRPARNRGT